MNLSTELLTVVGQKAIPDDEFILDIDYVAKCQLSLVQNQVIII